MMTRRSLRFLIGLGLAAPAAGQSGLKGRVVMEPTGEPLAGAEILIAAVGQSATSDANGEFLIESFRPGQHEVVVRRIGFQPRSRKLKFIAGETLLIDVVLTPTAVVIESLLVVGKPLAPRSGRLVGFEQRRQGHEGRFLTWADLRLKEYQRTHEILRDIGVRTVRDRLGRWVLVSGRAAGTCIGQIWVDGVRLSQSAAPLDVDDISIETLAGVEFYRGAAETPPEFNTSGATCGTLVLWTRDR